MVYERGGVGHLICLLQSLNAYQSLQYPVNNFMLFILSLSVCVCVYLQKEVF